MLKKSKRFGDRFGKRNGLYLPEHYMGCMGIEDQFPQPRSLVTAIRKGIMSPAGGGGTTGGSAGEAPVTKVERTGSVFTDGGTATTGATTYSFAVTVPADADCCLVFTGTYGEVIDVLNFDNGGDNDFTNDIGGNGYGGGGANFRVYVWRMLSNHGEWPGAGAKTLYYSFNNDCGYGPWVVCVFLKNVDTTTPISDYEYDDTGDGDWSCPAMTAGANDLSMVAMVTYNNTVDADPAGEGQTVVYESANTRSMGFGVGEEQGEDVMRIVAAGSNPGSLACVVKAA